MTATIPASVPAGAPVLELSSVRAGYGRIDVLHGVNLALAPGEERRVFLDRARAAVMALREVA